MKKRILNIKLTNGPAIGNNNGLKKKKDEWWQDVQQVQNYHESLYLLVDDYVRQLVLLCNVLVTHC